VIPPVEAGDPDAGVSPTEAGIPGEDEGEGGSESAEDEEEKIPKTRPTAEEARKLRHKLTHIPTTRFLRNLSDGETAATTEEERRPGLGPGT